MDYADMAHSYAWLAKRLASLLSGAADADPEYFLRELGRQLGELVAASYAIPDVAPTEQYEAEKEQTCNEHISWIRGMLSGDVTAADLPPDTVEVTCESAVAELLGDWDVYRAVGFVFQHELSDVDPRWTEQPEVAFHRISRGLARIESCLGDGLRLYDDRRYQDAMYQWLIAFFTDWGDTAGSLLRVVTGRARMARSEVLAA